MFPVRRLLMKGTITSTYSNMNVSALYILNEKAFSIGQYWYTVPCRHEVLSAKCCSTVGYKVPILTDKEWLQV